MHIEIDTIPHSQQRYPTVGDWIWEPDGTLHIFVSNMNNWKYEFLVARHELDEAILCRDRGITQKEVDDFDTYFEKERKQGLVTDEPGDDPRAPYNKEHFFATTVERLIARELNVDWQAYDKTVEEL